jgi:acyl transferase domain-containing protein
MASGELRKVDGVSRVHRAEFGHPLSIALQIALIDVLRSWGIKPDVVLGHSSGEMAAAYASGAITAEGAMAAATFRGTSNVSSDRKGSMAAIGLGRDEILPYLVPGVVIACDNSQLSVTISGDTEGVEQVIETLKKEQPSVFARLLRVEKAFHSRKLKLPISLDIDVWVTDTACVQLTCPSMDHHMKPISSRLYSVSILRSRSTPLLQAHA